MKNCSKKDCKQINPQLLENFNGDKNRKNGLTPWCKSCFKYYRDTHKSQRAEYHKIYRKNNEETLTQYLRNWHEKNKEEVNKKTKVYGKIYRKLNPGKDNARCRKRQSAKLQRTPNWLTKEQIKEIEENYILAKELRWLSEEPLEVDHIIPLQGKNISGLHVPWNLRIVPRNINRTKQRNFIQEDLICKVY